MAWIKIDDQAPDHPKLLKAGPSAAWLWLCAIAYCQRHLTDGFFPDSAVPFLGVAQAQARALLKTLTAVRLVERVDGGYRVHDYLDFQLSASEVKERRQADRKRKGIRTESARNPNGIRTESDDGIQSESDQNPIGIRTDSVSRARPREGILLSPGSGSGSGSSGGGPGEPSAQLALWDDFVAVGRTHGFDYRLQPTPKEYGHLVQLAGAYQPDELHAMAVAFWASAYLPADRNLGLFTSKSGALFKHVHDHITGPFGAPVDAKAVAAEAQQAAIRKWASS